MRDYLKWTSLFRLWLRLFGIEISYIQRIVSIVRDGNIWVTFKQQTSCIILIFDNFTELAMLL